ncbi:hypothetical protein M413DRAFT_22004 [Hebeloma cylindrosporum]|uniref:Protein kinase domain-containing protein n=1 Tax=Hebeloma cylindrosporum TaxID=76867 RepID=A0A0C2YJD5_HEBCY|nr:hypothetical protein M413DRAFT_22004 [Hebeloma cylindrosporum h7]
MTWVHKDVAIKSPSSITTLPRLPSHRFYPSRFDLIEDVESYKPGDFQGIAVGNTCAGGRYRVITNWATEVLAQSGSLVVTWKKLVALKVLRADLSSEPINDLAELVIPQKLSKYCPVACSEIQCPEDYPAEEGPPGSHLYVVYQLGGRT